MINQLTNEQFEEFMLNFNDRSVWLRVLCGTVNLDVYYPEFEFLIFTEIEKYQFGYLNYDEENNYQNIMIKIDDIEVIHISSIFDDEITLLMCNGIEIILGLNQGGMKMGNVNNILNSIVICDKCGKIIHDYDQIWFIRQLASYGSNYDGEYISKEICETCLDNFFGVGEGELVG